MPLQRECAERQQGEPVHFTGALRRIPAALATLRLSREVNAAVAVAMETRKSRALATQSE